MSTIPRERRGEPSLRGAPSRPRWGRRGPHRNKGRAEAGSPAGEGVN